MVYFILHFGRYCSSKSFLLSPHTQGHKGWQGIAGLPGQMGPFGRKGGRGQIGPQGQAVGHTCHYFSICITRVVLRLKTLSIAEVIFANIPVCLAMDGQQGRKQQSCFLW